MTSAGAGIAGCAETGTTAMGAAGGASTGCPHEVQKRAAGSRFAPQDVQNDICHLRSGIFEAGVYPMSRLD